MRDVLVHHYFSIDLDLAWRTATRDLPELGHRLKTILEELE